MTGCPQGTSLHFHAPPAPTRSTEQGTLRDTFRLPRGYWEAKDSKDDLLTEVRKKIGIGYPTTNTIFEDTSRAFNRNDFEKSLDRIYVAIEGAAKTLDNWTEKQHFLHTVYGRFFQGFSIKQADTHGIVYTPQEIVDFMCASVKADGASPAL